MIMTDFNLFTFNSRAYPEPIRWWSGRDSASAYAMPT